MNLPEYDSASAVDTNAPNESLDHVVSVALQQFSDAGYSNTKLDTIARDSGMSKRMIHYHFGDKKGLYRQVLQEAVRQLQPDADALTLDTLLPVEGLRRLIDAMWTTRQNHPQAMRLLVQESLHPMVVDDADQPIVDLSPLVLHLDRLLLLGQDSGAFRPGISARDIYTLISSLAFFQVSNSKTLRNLYQLDLTTVENTEGLHRLIVDTVLAFLTSQIPDTGAASYLTEEPLQSVNTIDTGSLYDDV